MAISATRVSRTLPASALLSGDNATTEQSAPAAPAAPAPKATKGNAPKATKGNAPKATKRAAPKAIILPMGKGSPERLAAGAKAAATRARNLAAMGIVPKAKQPKGPVNHQLAAYKAWATMHRNMLPGTKGAMRKAILGKIAHYESLIALATAPKAKATKATKAKRA